MTINVDTGKIRSLADTVAECGTHLGGYAPVAGNSRVWARGLDGAVGMPESQTATRVEETLKALDEVLRLHAERLNAFAEKARQDADVFDQMEATNTASLKEAAPR
ncbi:hypothetical protein IU501_17175 [Nocardia otitidiscaviarum]|uniref:hypothetical protein n=1 Tax=Nocardia otitidiscaviarum TaxID=1823 RepID=UPI0004A6BA79|nr:hypothetical protein [Nocardia otitidiscaviarum]MBF6134729.1 hypothetical protein [Nocardia otitidiscaviarum]MBF6485645.1 hypothetical protein [Nocardia otitidiscaviarum]